MGVFIGALTGAGITVMLLGYVPTGLTILAIATLATIIAIVKD